MSKEQQELLDEGYWNHLRTIRKEVVQPLLDRGWCVEPNYPTKEGFIDKCKTDDEFSENCGLKIEGRELSLEERIRMYALKEGQTYEEFVTNWNTDEQWSEDLSDATIPTKLITITYNDKTIESYE
jgi:hypothetical protein